MFNFTIARTIKLTITLFAISLMVFVLAKPLTAPTQAAAVIDDQATADLYAGKCKMCHGAKAEKFFDATGKTDEEMINAIMTGKKGEKPPFMPAFQPKGITQEQATALLAYMKSLKQ